MSAVHRKYKLSDIAEVLRGVSFGSSEGQDRPLDNYLPVLRAGNIQGQLLFETDLVWVPKTRVSQNQLIRQYDIVMCTSSGSASVVGKCARAEADWRGSFGAFCAGIRPNLSKCDPSYLLHYLRSPAFTNWSSLSAGANIKNIRKSELEDFEIPLPPLEEQCRIAAILDKADAIRRKRQQSIRLTEEFLRSTFLEMFGDPVTNPKGWEQKELGDVMFIDAPMVDPQLDDYQDLLHIGPDRIEKATGRILPALTAREDKLISGKFLFDERHVLYSKIRPLLRKAALPNFKGLCSADMYPIRPNLKFTNREFLWSILLSDAFTDFTQTISSRANIPKINRTELSSYKCIMPPIELQNRYAKMLTNNDLIGKKLTNSAGYIDDLFTGLTHRAFRGEL